MGYIAFLNATTNHFHRFFLFFLLQNGDFSCFNNCLIKSLKLVPGTKLRDNHIQNFHLGRYIVGYTVGNLVLQRHVSGAVKLDFRTYIRRYTSQNENFEYGYPHFNALLTFSPQKDSENALFCAYTSSNVCCIEPLASCIYSLVNQ